MLKNFFAQKVQKNALFFISQAPTHHSFTLNLQFLYQLGRKVRLFKTVCGIFHFRFRFVFIQSRFISRLSGFLLCVFQEVNF